MKAIFIIAILAVSINAFAQKEIFGLAEYTPPREWKKQIDENGVQFSKEDTTTGGYCAISLLRAIPGNANSKENFDMAWEALVKEMVKVTVDPEMQPPATEDGWETQSGHAGFEIEGEKGVVILVTSTGYGQMVNLIILTNTNQYESDVTEFLDSISLKKPGESVPENKTENKTDNNTILGTWGVSKVMASYYNMGTSEGSILTQYTFNPDGTYTFYIKTFKYQYDKLLLTREKGTYVIDGNTITIIPNESVIESWSKKDGTSEFGTLVSSQKKELEKATYQFSTQDLGNGNMLVFKAANETKRDGPFNNSEKDAWLYPAKSDLEIIKLPD